MIRRQQPVEIDGAPLQLRAIRTLDAGLSAVGLTRRRARVGHGKERVVHARSVARRLLRGERFLHNLFAGALPSAGGIGGPFEAPQSYRPLSEERRSRAREVSSARGKLSTR